MLNEHQRQNKNKKTNHKQTKNRVKFLQRDKFSSAILSKAFSHSFKHMFKNHHQSYVRCGEDPVSTGVMKWCSERYVTGSRSPPRGGRFSSSLFLTINTFMTTRKTSPDNAVKPIPSGQALSHTGRITQHHLLNEGYSSHISKTGFHSRYFLYLPSLALL